LKILKMFLRIICGYSFNNIGKIVLNEIKTMTRTIYYTMFFVKRRKKVTNIIKGNNRVSKIRIF
jgi:hypothetical protein